LTAFGRLVFLIVFLTGHLGLLSIAATHRRLNQRQKFPPYCRRRVAAPVFLRRTSSKCSNLYESSAKVTSKWIPRRPFGLRPPNLAKTLRNPAKTKGWPMVENGRPRVAPKHHECPVDYAFPKFIMKASDYCQLFGWEFSTFRWGLCFSSRQRFFLNIVFKTRMGHELEENVKVLEGYNCPYFRWNLLMSECTPTLTRV
jgi:hypothetical protein